MGPAVTMHVDDCEVCGWEMRVTVRDDPVRDLTQVAVTHLGRLLAWATTDDTGDVEEAVERIQREAGCAEWYELAEATRVRKPWPKAFRQTEDGKVVPVHE